MGRAKFPLLKRFSVNIVEVQCLQMCFFHGDEGLRHYIFIRVSGPYFPVFELYKRSAK